MYLLTITPNYMKLKASIIILFKNGLSFKIAPTTNSISHQDIWSLFILLYNAYLTKHKKGQFIFYAVWYLYCSLGFVTIRSYDFVKWYLYCWLILQQYISDVDLLALYSMQYLRYSPTYSRGTYCLHLWGRIIYLCMR